MKRINVFIVVILISLSLYTTVSYAGSERMPAFPRVSVYPGKYLYPIKRVYEKAREMVLFDDSARLKYYKEETLEKLAELSKVVDEKNDGKIETSAGRLSAYMAFEKNSLEKLGDKQEFELAHERFLAYANYLRNLRDKYEANSAQWLLISYNIDVASRFASELYDKAS